LIGADLNSMSVDKLWNLHAKVNEVLCVKLSSQKVLLDAKLSRLGHAPVKSQASPTQARRPYPKVFPKYQNPKLPAETWSGRGKRPRWLAKELRSGKHIDEFRIAANG
jgi:DNA-binding protein H-NS